MGIDGIGRGSGSQRKHSTYDTHGSQRANSTHPTHDLQRTRGPQRAVNPEPAAAQSNPALAFRDGFDAAARDFSKLGGGVPAPSPESVAEIQRTLENILHGAQMLEIRALLQQSPTGAAALEFMDAHQLPVSFTGGGESYWDAQQRQIVIDAAHDPQQAALTLVHELHHARASLVGDKPDVLHDTRDEYVRGMLEEEALGTIASIETKRELVANGQTVTALFSQEDAYTEAYEAAVDAAEQSNPQLSAAELHARGTDAGRRAVLQRFLDGDVLASRGEVRYPDYYGAAWDQNHP